MEPTELLTAQQAADYLGLAVGTLYNWRHTHTGPPSISVGRAVRYRRSDLDAWLDANTVSP